MRRAERDDMAVGTEGCNGYRLATATTSASASTIRWTLGVPLIVMVYPSTSVRCRLVGKGCG